VAGGMFHSPDAQAVHHHHRFTRLRCRPGCSPCSDFRVHLNRFGVQLGPKRATKNLLIRAEARGSPVTASRTPRTWSGDPEDPIARTKELRRVLWLDDRGDCRGHRPERGAIGFGPSTSVWAGGWRTPMVTQNYESAADCLGEMLERPTGFQPVTSSLGSPSDATSCVTAFEGHSDPPGCDRDAPPPAFDSTWKYDSSRRWSGSPYPAAVCTCLPECSGVLPARLLRRCQVGEHRPHNGPADGTLVLSPSTPGPLPPLLPPRHSTRTTAVPFLVRPRMAAVPRTWTPRSTRWPR
jgi:hypothetical protein